MWADDADWGKFMAAFEAFWPGHFGKGFGVKAAQWQKAATAFRPASAIQALREIYDDQEFPRAPTLKLFREAAKGLETGQATRDSRQKDCETCLNVRSLEIEMFLVEVGSPVLKDAPVKIAEEFKFQGRTWDAVDVRIGEKLGSDAIKVAFPVWCGACARPWVPETAKANVLLKGRLRGKFRPQLGMLAPHLESMIAMTKLYDKPSLSCKEIAADEETWRTLRARYAGNEKVLAHLDSWQKSLASGAMPQWPTREPGDE